MSGIDTKAGLSLPEGLGVNITPFLDLSCLITYCIIYALLYES